MLPMMMLINTCNNTLARAYIDAYSTTCTSLINHRSRVVFVSLYVRCAICAAAFDTDMVADSAETARLMFEISLTLAIILQLEPYLNWPAKRLPWTYRP